MGEIVGVGLVSHVPTMVLPEEIRRDDNRGPHRAERDRD